MFLLCLIAVFVSGSMADSCDDGKEVGGQCFINIPKEEVEEMFEKFASTDSCKFHMSKAKEICERRGAHILRLDMFKPNDDKVKAVSEWGRPGNTIYYLIVDCSYNEDIPILIDCSKPPTSTSYRILFYYSEGMFSGKEAKGIDWCDKSLLDGNSWLVCQRPATTATTPTTPTTPPSTTASKENKQETPGGSTGPSGATVSSGGSAVAPIGYMSLAQAIMVAFMQK